MTDNSIIVYMTIMTLIMITICIINKVSLSFTVYYYIAIVDIIIKITIIVVFVMIIIVEWFKYIITIYVYLWLVPVTTLIIHLINNISMNLWIQFFL